MQPALDPQPRGSFAVRYQNAVLRWALAGLLVLMLAYALGWWLQGQGWATAQFPATVLWCVIPYAMVTQWLYQGAYLPHFERVSYVVVAATMPFALTPLGFALAQHPYSRGAVLLAYGLTAAWFLLGYRAIRRRDVLHLACLDPALPARLQARIGSPRLETLPLVLHVCQGTPFPAPCDGVVLDPASPSDARHIRALKQSHTRLYSLDAVAEMLTGRCMLPQADALWEQDVRPAYDVAKRMFDLSATVLTLPLWLPLCLLTALAVKVDSPGPALFSQQRTGLHGRPFRLWKLRSMHHAQCEAARTRPAQPGDDRITRAGRFIRRTRLDELPQLWNVLRGDMSLIGPRPEQVPFVHEFAQRIPAYPYRHWVRPGLTGWAQVQQGYTDGAAEAAVKLGYDLYYVTHYSLALDLLIIYKTVRIVLTGFGAR